MSNPNLLGRALRYFVNAFDYARAPIKTTPRRRNPILGAMFDTNSLPPTTDAQEDYYMRMGVTNSALYYAINTIAKRSADVKNFMTQKRDGDEWADAPKHQFMELLRRPNSLMSGTLLLSELTWWFQLSGNAYLFLDTPAPGRGPILGLYPISSNECAPDPLSVRISETTMQPVVDYAYTPAGRSERVPGENIIHFRMANPFDFWVGMSPLTALQNALDMSFAQTDWLSSYFDGGNAIPTAIISVPAETDDPDFDEVKRTILEDFGQKRRAAITRAGDLSVETIQHTIEEMRVLEGIGYNASEILRVYGIPEGLTNASSGQSRLAAETALARDVIQPQINYYAEVMSSVLMHYYGDDFQIAGQNVVPQDRAMEISEYQTYGIDATVNEARAERGREPIKLSGPLEILQPLLDDVPTRLIDMAGQILLQSGGAGGAAAADGEVGGVDVNPLVAELIGAVDETDAVVAEMVGASITVKPQSGNGAGVQNTGDSVEVGPRANGGMQTPAQLIDDAIGDMTEDALPPTKSLSGLDELDPGEIDAILWASVAGTDQDVDELRAAILSANGTAGGRRE